MADYTIPLQFQTPPPIPQPNFGQAIQSGNALKQLQTQNQLRGILGAPGAVDPATGMPTPDAISKVMSVDPAAGIKLGENSVINQERQLQMQGLRSKASREQAQLLNDTFAPIVLEHEDAIKSGKITPQQAEAASQDAWTKARENLVRGGLPPEVAKNIPTQWNYADAKRRAMASDVYLTNVKRQADERREAQTERHQTAQEQTEAQRAGQAGTVVLQDSDGRPMVLRPNAPSGQPKATYIDGTVVPEDKLPGAHKMGTGVAAGKTADNAAIEADILKQNPDWTPGQAKLERMRQTAAAGSKSVQDPAKGWDLLTDTDGTPYQHRKGTGESLTMDGQPYAPKGATKLGGPRSASATNQDRDAIANVTRSDYEKELGRPVNLADPNEKAELDRRVLAAEDKRVADRTGAQTTARTAAQQAVAKPVPVTVNGVRQDALWRDGKYVNLDGTPMEGKILGASRSEGKKTPGQAVEEDAMSVADKRIAAMETQRGTPLDQAERAEQRQIARADPKIQQKAREQDANAIDDDAAKLIAEESLRGDWHGTVGMGRNQASMRKIAEWRGRLAKENNMTGADLAANTAEYMGILAAERVLGTRGAGIDLGIAEAGKFAPMVLRASDMVDRTKFPTVNSLLLAAEKGTGGEAVIRLIDSLNAYKMAYTQILTRGGMPTDDSRRRADEIIDKAWSNGQIKTALDQLNQEMNGARSAVPEVRDNLYKALTGKSRTSPVDQVPSPVQGPQRTEQGAGASQIPTITHDDAGKKAYEALAPGAEFMSEGARYRKPGQAPPASQPPQAQPTSAPVQQTAPTTQPPATPSPTQSTAPIPLKAGMKEADLQDGTVYETARGAARWDKAQKKFFPVGSR